MIDCGLITCQKKLHCCVHYSPSDCGLITCKKGCVIEWSLCIDKENKNKTIKPKQALPWKNKLNNGKNDLWHLSHLRKKKGLTKHTIIVESYTNSAKL